MPRLGLSIKFGWRSCVFEWVVTSIWLILRRSAQIHLVSDEVRRAELEELAHVERMVMVPMQVLALHTMH